jgi:ribonuclease HI
MKNQLFGSNKLIIYTDGGARGNPGPAAIGAVVGEKKYAEYIGKATNNVAEYKAVIFALKKAKHLLGGKADKTEIEIRMDSELVVRQLSGIYRIKEDDLKILFADVHNLEFDFKEISFIHIPREKNKEADKLVNEELDRKR